ncbi:ADP-ribosylglycohydrolase family protein [Bradyrhizobium sp. 17]|uniref:ADP-ribosylglycohydrolase family protein n=1 Tax=Bradyrhizobium sp. 17 TaxID=2782649 RepID=UPI001FFA13B5|nr:ADP-ribosylglycohydrolase family protein [Bradyrhizobium sp. 17]
MAGYFSEISASDRPSREGYYSCSLYRDEIWPSIEATYDFIGYRDPHHFAGGWVSVRADGSASYLIDPALNTPEFLNVIAAQTGTELVRARIAVTGKRAPAHIGAPVANDYDAHIPFGVKAEKSSEPKLGRFIEDSAYGAMLGLAVGDAIGVPLEFSERDALPHVSEMIGGGPFGLEPGEWTDDTSMALCLADSLIAQRTFDGFDVLNRFVRWWEDGENSVNGRCFDIGITTRAALERYARLGTPAGDGAHNKNHAGNGSIMRLAPIAVFAAHDRSEAVRLAHRQSMLTHANRLAASACEFFATLLVEAMRGTDRNTVLRSRFWFSHPELNAIAAGNWIGKTRDEISSSGYVISTLEAALWCVHRTSSFEEAIILAVNLGNDSDTVGAVTGQLAGAIYGRSGIPTRWLEQLAWREDIERRIGLLVKAANSGNGKAEN